MHKDNSYEDFDILEDKFLKLNQAKVVTADYELLRKDFGSLLSNMSDK